MPRRLLMVLSMIGCCVSACAPPAIGPADIASTPAPLANEPAKSTTLRIADPTAPGLPDVPYWMALDTLRQQGYVVETIQYARWDLTTTGLSSGEVGIASSSHQTAAAAIGNGARIHAIVGRSRRTYALVATPEIEACADLEAKNVALASTTGVIGALVEGYIERNCPGTQPQIVVIPPGENRAAALLSGVVDAAQLDDDVALELERQTPGTYRVLCSFADEFPEVDITAFYANDDFASQHPDLIKDFVGAYVEAVRRVQDPQALREEIARYLPDDAAALANGEAYLARQAWDVNGGLTPERIESTLAFLTDAELVPPGVQVEDVADLSYLEAVLEEIGRQ